MNLDILICTFNEGILNVPKILLSPRNDLFYKISFQVTDEKYNIIPKELSERQDVTVSVIYSIGLCKNRNNSLQMAKSELCLISDDDVSYTHQYIDDIINLFSTNNSLDIITGKINTPSSEPEYKNYPKVAVDITSAIRANASSVEIAFRRDSIIKNSICFDEDYGIGGKIYGSFEETIFMNDSLEKQLKIKFFPVYFVNHPYESTGKKSKFNERHCMIIGNCYYLRWGRLSYLLLFLLAIKNYRTYSKYMSYFKYIRNVRKGINHISLRKKLF